MVINSTSCFYLESLLPENNEPAQYELQSLHVSQSISGNRHYYLRWDTFQTQIYIEKAGFNYYATGGYVDRPGFKHGVYYEFNMFDLLARKKLNLVQRLLIVIELRVLDEQYMGIGYGDEGLKVMKDFKEKCYRYNGNFSLICSNSHFINLEDRIMFEELIW